MDFHQSPHTYIGEVTIKVTDLKQALQFYERIIGFTLLELRDDMAVLTADGDRPLLILKQPPGPLPKQTRTTGLYHFALLLPERADLAAILRHFIQFGYPLQGASDHLVSEAIYLADPDGNGIEIYVDRPADLWQWEHGEVVMTTEALNTEGLLRENNHQAWQGLPEQTMMGHIHLHVADLEETRTFYTEGLGFEVSNSQYGSQVLFVSSGGYHHHVGLNVWNGKGAPPPPSNSAGLQSFSVMFPGEQERNKAVSRLKEIGAAVREEQEAVSTTDPSGNTILLKNQNIED